MNDRIRELANEAWCTVNQRIGFSDVQRQVLFEQQYAELIVRECADLCTNPLDTEDILEYFGVAYE